MQYSVLSIAEIDMMSSGSGYEWHLTINPFKKNLKKNSKKNLTVIFDTISYVKL